MCGHRNPTHLTRSLPHPRIHSLASSILPRLASRALHRCAAPWLGAVHSPTPAAFSPNPTGPSLTPALDVEAVAASRQCTSRCRRPSWRSSSPPSAMVRLRRVLRVSGANEGVPYGQMLPLGAGWVLGGGGCVRRGWEQGRRMW
jgi:hypothetical protein